MRNDSESSNFDNSNNVKRSILGIRGRLLIGFSVIAVLMLVMVITTISFVTSTKNEMTTLLRNDLPTYDSTLNLYVLLNAFQSDLYEYVLTRDDKIKGEINRIWSSNIVLLITKIDKNINEKSDDKAISGWNDLKKLIYQLRDIEKNITRTSSASVDERKFVAEFEDISGKIKNNLDGFVNDKGYRSGGIIDDLLANLQNGVSNVLLHMNRIQIVVYSLSFIVIISGIFAAVFTSRGILKHINIFRQHSSRIASGDLREKILMEGTDEIGQLGRDLNIMTESLRSITKQITEACHNMVTTLEQVQHSVDVQSSGATEQASSINQITASLEEIEKSSTQTMEKAQALGDIAEKTREKGDLGIQAVEQSINGMKVVRQKVEIIAETILDLSNQTQKIGEITSVVNNLAQQSKMLALNASIEAAKAGEAGKGFAVVATEVKNLAEQSEQSTVQVQKILENIRQAAEKAVMVTEEGTKGVDQGTGLVEETGNIVKNLSDVINQASIASQQIEAAVRQEGVGIEQITAGMNEINQVTASFVESVKQTTEAINNLAVIAKNLKEYIDTYKI